MPDPPPVRAPRSGRRPGPTDTRETILRAAVDAFGEAGYGAASLRGIARTAGVDPALVVHFFGSKAGLFLEAVEWPFDPESEMRRVVADGPGRVGANLAEMFIAHWESERERSPIVAMLHVATGEPSGARMMRDFMDAYMLEPLSEVIGGEEAHLRAGLIIAQLLGLGIARYVLETEPLASSPVPLVTATLAAAIQRTIDEPLVHPDARRSGAGG